MTNVPIFDGLTSVLRACAWGSALWLGVALATTPVRAMEFVVREHAAGFSVVVGKGPITSGDAERLLSALEVAPADPVVGKVLSLDSPGGEVDAAFEMVAVMDRVGVTTLLDVDAVCLSACASVLFVSGKYRLALKGSYLGMHHCYLSDGALAPHCNERMAQNALEHGVPYGSVMAFVRHTKPEHILLMSAAEATCYGLTRWPGDDPEDLAAAPCVIAALKGEPLPLGPLQLRPQ